MTRYALSALNAQSHTQRWWFSSVVASGSGLREDMVFESPADIEALLSLPGESGGEELSGVGSSSRYSSSGAHSQILTVWSAEQVASFLLSGDNKIRVR